MFNYSQVDSANIQYFEIIPEDELKDGERLFIDLFKIAGEFFAIGDICSHDNGPVGDGEIEGNEIICPRHGGRFDIHTGKATSLPALVDIPAYPVRVNNDKVEIGIPKE
jgi:3-phenylpropionate/trans-cinnamate dioxygenase ferredoxin subunit